jgi:anti-repressor protein
MNQLLAEYKIQRYVNGQWTLRTPYLSNSFMKSVTVNTPNGLFQSSMWTQEGRQFLYRFLKQKGYIPLYEKKQLEPKEKTLFDGINDQ